MYNRPVEILLVEPDADVAAMACACLQAAMNANVTVASEATAALREELTTTHDVLLIANELPDARWIELVRELRQRNRGPFILLAQDPPVSDVVDALRAGAMDVLSKPFDMAHLAELVGRAIRRASQRRRHQMRTRRLRKLTARIICERRDLRQRIDLICRDFVHAYRRLAQRVTEAELISER